jgi:hypothetical protein
MQGAAGAASDEKAMGDGAATEPEQKTLCFSRAGGAYRVDNWDLFQAVSANDVVAFARNRYPEVDEALENVDDGSYAAERLRDQIRRNKVYRRELSTTRSALRDADFMAPDDDTFGLEHLGRGKFFLFVAGGSSDPFSDVLIQGRMKFHDRFTMATMKRYRKLLGPDGVIWGLELLGLPESVRDRIEENFDEAWKLRWRWKGLGRLRSSWTLDSGSDRRPGRLPSSIYTLRSLALEIVDGDGATLWQVE